MSVRGMMTFESFRDNTDTVQILNDAQLTMLKQKSLASN